VKAGMQEHGMECRTEKSRKCFNTINQHIQFGHTAQVCELIGSNTVFACGPSNQIRVEGRSGPNQSQQINFSQFRHMIVLWIEPSNQLRVEVRSGPNQSQQINFSQFQHMIVL